MWVLDQEKAQAKDSLSRMVQGEANRVARLLGEVRSQIAVLDYTMGGAPSGIGSALVERCQRAAGELSDALGQLNACLGQINQLNVMKWEDDYDFDRRY